MVIRKIEGAVDSGYCQENNVLVTQQVSSTCDLSNCDNIYKICTNVIRLFVKTTPIMTWILINYECSADSLGLFISSPYNLN